VSFIFHGYENFPVPFERSVSKTEAKMKLRKIGVVLMAILLAAMAMVPMVSAAAEARMNNLNTAQPQLTKLVDNPEAIMQSCPGVQDKEAVINTLIGKNITVADFYEKLYPGCVAKLPSNVQELYKNQRMTWPQLSKAQLQKSLSKAESDKIESDLRATSSNDIFVPSITHPLSPASTTISLNGISVAWKGSTTIYQSLSTVYPPVAMTYMSTTSNLFMLQNGNFVNIANKQVVGVFVSSQTAQGVKSVNPGLFQVLGEHYGIAPLGYYPTEVLVYSTSNYFTVP
jgi:hypothetical protein